MKTILLIAVGLQLLLLPCSGQTDKQQLPLQKIQTADSLVIGFKDASVPPAYHRSYEMIFTPTKARYRLYAYDSTLQVQDTSFSKTKFDELTAMFVQHHIKAGKQNGQTNGCTGGTSRYVQGFTLGKAVLNGSVYYCGSNSSGTVEGNLAELCREAKKYFTQAVKGEKD